MLLGLACRLMLHQCLCAQAESKARGILRALEEAKLSGTDYSVSALAELREVLLLSLLELPSFTSAFTLPVGLCQSMALACSDLQ